MEAGKQSLAGACMRLGASAKRDKIDYHQLTNIDYALTESTLEYLAYDVICVVELMSKFAPHQGNKLSIGPMVVYEPDTKD